VPKIGADGAASFPVIHRLVTPRNFVISFFLSLSHYPAFRSSFLSLLLLRFLTLFVTIVSSFLPSTGLECSSDRRKKDTTCESGIEPLSPLGLLKV
jgi:hypothetical protein